MFIFIDDSSRSFWLLSAPCNKSPASNDVIVLPGAPGSPRECHVNATRITELTNQLDPLGKAINDVCGVSCGGKCEISCDPSRDEGHGDAFHNWQGGGTRCCSRLVSRRARSWQGTGHHMRAVEGEGVEEARYNLVGIAGSSCRSSSVRTWRGRSSGRWEEWGLCNTLQEKQRVNMMPDRTVIERTLNFLRFRGALTATPLFMFISWDVVN